MTPRELMQVIGKYSPQTSSVGAETTMGLPYLPRRSVASFSGLEGTPCIVAQQGVPIHPLLTEVDVVADTSSKGGPRGVVPGRFASPH